MTENADQEPREAPPIGAVWNGTSWDPPTQSDAPAAESPPDGSERAQEPVTLVVPPPRQLPAEQGTWWTKQRIVTIVAVVVGMGLLIAALSSVSKGSKEDRVAADSTVPVATAAAVPTYDAEAWLPSGYELTPEPGLGWRPNGGVSCGDFWKHCMGVDVVAQYGCPSGVFVEMAQVDATGALVNASNAIGPALSAGARSTIVVGWLDPSPTGKVQVTRMNCM